MINELAKGKANYFGSFYPNFLRNPYPELAFIMKPPVVFMHLRGLTKKKQQPSYIINSQVDLPAILLSVKVAAK